MKSKNKIITLSLMCGLWYLNTPDSFAQEVNDNTPTEELFQLDLEQLMNVSIVSASKKSESVFDAPSSSSVVTREEIKKAGCTSIMEAFRLMPGLIVREQTNGNFDVHLRGLDNVPPNSFMVNMANTTTLVMIDNRPVYNYLQGGTFWESLPVDLNDVERIEIVRGPSSAMYGPNAVTGVIHIITRKLEKEGLNIVSNAQYGTHNSAIANATVGYKLNSKWNFAVSGNFQNRDRDKVEYFEARTLAYAQSPNEIDVENPEERYPNPEKSVNKFGTNAYINYNPKENVYVNFSAGLQNSEVQKVYAENLATPISTATSKTRYADLRIGVKNLSAQISNLGGTQDPSLGFVGSTYDFNTLDAYVEYAVKIKNFTIKPGYNFRQAVYDDAEYWDASIKEGMISGRKEILTNALSIRGDGKILKDKLRLFGGIRLDKFNNPGKVYFSYQISPTFSINEKNLIRIAASKANRSPFIYDTYIDSNQPRIINIASPPYKIPVIFHLMGNKETKLVTSYMYEIGWRSQITKNVQLDIDAFKTITTNYTEVILGNTDISQLPFRTEAKIENLPLVVRQMGTTLSLNVVVSKLQLKPFVTLQKTRLQKYSSYYYSADARPTGSNPDPTVNNYLNGSNVDHEGTPSVYGGAFINYQATSKFNINFNPYFFTGHELYHRDHNSYNDGARGEGKVNSKILINTRVSYKPIKMLDVFVSGKNILGNTSREFFNSDRIGPQFLVGANLEF